MNSYEAPFYTKEDLRLLDEKEIHFPFSDDDAKYCGLEHQYELTSKYFQERGRNLEIEVEGTEPDMVIDEFQEGFMLGDRVIRHSVVKVSK